MIRLLCIRGFTLLELLVVMVIVGLMSSLIVPQLGNSLGNLNAKTSARKVAASLRYARSRAVAENIIWLTVTDFEANQLVIRPYRKKNADGAGDGTEDGTERVGEAKIYKLPEGVRFQKAISSRDEVFETEAFEMAFFPGGGASGGKIFLTDDREQQWGVAVDIITGVVRLLDDDGRDT